MNVKNIKIITCLHKHYEVEDWLNFINTNKIDFNYLTVSTGISDRDFLKTQNILELVPQIKMICIDVANGYAEKFVETVKKFRDSFSDKIIIAGNVVTIVK